MGKVASYVVPSDLPVGVTASFQWLRNGQAIPGQTTPKHKITKRDRRKRLSLRVTYSRPGYADTVMETPPSRRIR